MIEEQLPELHEQLVTKYEENVLALEQMGPALSGELEVRRLLVTNCNLMSKKIEDSVLVNRNNETSTAAASEEAIWNKIEDLFMSTYHKILGTKPLFCNGEEELPSLEEEGVQYESGREATCGMAGVSPITAGCHVQIEEVRKRIEECRGRNLKVAGSPPAYMVAMEMLKKTALSWERFALEVLETVLELMTQTVRQCAEEVLREYPALHQRIVDHLLTLLAEIAVRTHQQVAFFMEMESANPFTVNAHYLDSQVTKATINLRKKMGKFSVNNLDEYQRRQLSALIAEGGGDMTLMWVADRTGRGENELVTAMAIAQSYFKVSHKRFSDNLLMAVDHMMLRGFATRVEQHLLDSLQVFEAPAETLLSMVREDEVKSRRRQLIENAVKRQRDGINRLDSFMTTGTVRSNIRRTVGTASGGAGGNPDSCIGLPDVSGIFSSGRSLSALLQGSRLGDILNTSNQAQTAAVDRRNADKKDREERKAQKKKKEEKQRKEERKRIEKEEKAREKKEREAEARRRQAELLEKQKDEIDEKLRAGMAGVEKKEIENPSTTGATDMGAEFEALKAKLMAKKEADITTSGIRNSPGKDLATLGPLGTSAVPKAMTRPREDSTLDEEEAKRLRKVRFGQA